MGAKLFLLLALWWAASAHGGQKEENDEEILKDMSFFYYMEVSENLEILEAPDLAKTPPEKEKKDEPAEKK